MQTMYKRIENTTVIFRVNDEGDIIGVSLWIIWKTRLNHMKH